MREQVAGMENPGMENSGVDSRSGKCRSSLAVWKAALNQDCTYRYGLRLLHGNVLTRLTE